MEQERSADLKNRDPLNSLIQGLLENSVHNLLIMIKDITLEDDF